MEPSQSDHDLLIEMRTELRGVREDVKGLRDDTKLTLADHENRLRLIEKNENRWIGRQSVVSSFLASAVTICATYLIEVIVRTH